MPESRFEAYLAALKKLGPEDPNRQSEALKAAGMVPYAVTTYPLDTSRTKRSASIRGEQQAGG